MARAQTPIKVVFDTLKGMHLTKGSLAALLFRADCEVDGVVPRERVSDPYVLSRLLACDPDNAYPEACYREFSTSAQTICARLTSKGWQPDAIVSQLAGKPGDAMRRALDTWHRDGRLYQSAFGRACAMRELPAADRASLVLLVFVSTGCLADPDRAIVLAEDLCESMGAGGFRTTGPSLQAAAPDGTRSQADEGMPAGARDAHLPRLGIVRVTDGLLDLAELHELSCEEGGTTIGTMVPSNAGDAFNVTDPRVSRKHLRIWRDDDGRWRACGLGSTNGTTLISGSDKSERVIEAPKRERRGRRRAAPVEVRAGDSLVLAGCVVFLLIPIR